MIAADPRRPFRRQASVRLRAAAASIALLPLATLSACTIDVRGDAYTAREEKRFTVAGTVDLELVSFDGSIEVRGGDRSDVVVEVEKAGSSKEIVDAIRVVARQDGNRIRVEALGPDSSEWMIGVGRLHRSARIVATVPRDCNLLADSRDGSIKVERLKGRLELRSGDGSVQAYDLDGSVLVDTSDGSVKLQGISGTVDARSGDGSLTVDGRLTNARLRTEDGSVTLRLEPGSAMAEDWDVQTGDGSVSVQFPEGFAAEIDASTGDGAVRADDDLGLRASGEEPRRLTGTLGSGGRRLTLRSGDGSIVLRRY
jgi:DUF4097 and DUF4098 domain-containing protein YvlB